MKIYFKATLFVAFTLFAFRAYAQSGVRPAGIQKSIALVLQCTGKNSIPEQVKLYSKNVFTGKVKNIQTKGVAKFQEAIHVKFFDDSGLLLFDDYQQNPLSQNMESAEPDGSLKQNKVVSNNGYLNFRFPVSDNIKNIKAICYFIVNNEEKEISTLNIIL